MPKKQINFLAEPELTEKLKDEAKEKRIPFSQHIRDILWNHVDSK